MDKETQYAPQRAIESSIIEIRGSKVILDTDLAAIYGVQTFRFNEIGGSNLRLALVKSVGHT